jgi:hypothetical protein
LLHVHVLASSGAAISPSAIGFAIGVAIAIAMKDVRTTVMKRIVIAAVYISVEG